MLLLDLYERFGVSVSLFSKAFTTWINFLYHKLALYFSFPSQKLVKRHLGKRFEKYPIARIVIDRAKILLIELL